MQLFLSSALKGMASQSELTKETLEAIFNVGNEALNQLAEKTKLVYVRVRFINKEHPLDVRVMLGKYPDVVLWKYEELPHVPAFENLDLCFDRIHPSVYFVSSVLDVCTYWENFELLEEVKEGLRSAV